MADSIDIKEGFQRTEVGLIPKDWNVKKLGDVGDVKMCKRIFNNETKSQGTIPFYKIGTFGKEPDAYISEDLYNNYRQRFSFPKKDDILISAAGTIGRTLVYDGKPAYFQDSNIVWIDNNETLISNKFLFYVFQVVNYNTEGGTIQRLYNNILRNTKFICPPTKTEQTAIATALNDADSLITALEKLIAKKRAIKHGALQELMKPKDGWVEKKLGDEIDFQGGSQPPLTTFISSQMEGYIRLLQIRDYKSDKYETYIPLCLAKRFCKKDDIMIGRYGPPVFQILKGLEGSYNVALMKAVPSSKIYKQYAYYFLKQDSLFNFIEKLSQRTAGQSGIDMKELKDYPFPIPPFEEQIRIAQILSDMDAEIEQLEQKLAKQKMIKQGMMQVLLTGKIRLV